MGAVCCVAVKDKTVQNGSSNESLQRNIRCSPTWSFRWDNHRGRVAGEETSVTWFSDGISRNGGSDTKYELTNVSEDASPAESFQRCTWQKSPVSEGTTKHVRTPVSEQSVSGNVSMEVNLEQVKEISESPAVSYSSPTKLSPSLASTSSVSTSPLSSQSQLHPASSTPPKLPRSSPAHPLVRQVSDGPIPGAQSPRNYATTEERTVIPSWSNESTRGSRGGSSDGWSMPAFPELMCTSRRERWSFDSDALGLIHEKLSRSSSLVSSSPPVNIQMCGVCSKLLSEKSSWGSQKIIASNELSVVAVLTCGHVYHAECLENMTPETDKYDPACPVCTLGEKQILKLSQKALKAEQDLKARHRRSRKQVVDGDFDSGSFVFDQQKGSRHEEKGPKMTSSSSMKSSFGRPFLRRHFSFGSKGSRSLSENHSTRKKGLFWAKSSKM